MALRAQAQFAPIVPAHDIRLSPCKQDMCRAFTQVKMADDDPSEKPSGVRCVCQPAGQCRQLMAQASTRRCFGKVA